MSVAWNHSPDTPDRPDTGRRGRFGTFRFALVTTDGRPLGAIAYVRPDSRPGDITPQGLRVVQVLDQSDDELRILVVEPVSEDAT
jgi:hypothetical protein